jgi:hypothetical protein
MAAEFDFRQLPKTETGKAKLRQLSRHFGAILSHSADRPNDRGGLKGVTSVGRTYCTALVKRVRERPPLGKPDCAYDPSRLICLRVSPVDDART